jgi:TatD DNase family protein
MYINIHTHFNTGRQIEVVSRTFDDVLSEYFSFGIHPWEIDKWENKLDFFDSFLSLKGCLAVGEIGLDKLKGPVISKQIELFKQQIIFSEEFHLPVILHCVKAWNELRVLKRELNPKQTWIFHGFTKSMLTDEVLKEGIYISIGNAILTSPTLQYALKNIPLDRLFLETDDAECAIEEIYAKVSELKNIPLSQLQSQLEENFKNVFTKWITG